MLPYLKADRICVHHLFQAWSGNFFTFLLVRFRNCFRDPDDMYSVMKITCVCTMHHHKDSGLRLRVAGFVSPDVPSESQETLVCSHSVIFRKILILKKLGETQKSTMGSPIYLKIHVFLGIELYQLVSSDWYFREASLQPEDGGSKLHWNVSNYLQT